MQPVFVAPVLYVPAAHNVQLVAPVDPEPVEEPAPQSAQAVWESGLCLPAAHAVHVVAPVLVSVLVTEPAAHEVQLFAVHEAVQIGVGVEGVPPAEGVRRYLPAAHAVHVVAPVLEPVFVMDPAGQAPQSVVVIAVVGA